MTDDPGTVGQPPSARPSPSSNQSGRRAFSAVGLVVAVLFTWVAFKPLLIQWSQSDPATELNQSGHALYEEGRYEDALSYFQRALAADEEAHGKDYPHTAVALDNIGMVLNAQGKYQQAQSYYQRALALIEKGQPKDERLLATALSGIGGALKAQGKCAEAAPLLDRALRIFERDLSAAHPNTRAVAAQLAYCSK